MSYYLKKLVSFHTRPIHSSNGTTIDLSLITDQIIVCSCPTTKKRKSLYRNNLEDLIEYLNNYYGDCWHLWNLRSELGDAYDVKGPLLTGKISYTPWPDHQSPTFEQLYMISHEVSTFLKEDEARVSAIHCKLGKGRSGLIAVSVMIMSFGYTLKSAEKLFTQKRMRRGFGSGISIQCQQRYAMYMEKSTKNPGALGLYFDYSYQERRAKVRALRVIGQKFGVSDLRKLTTRLCDLSDDDPSFVFTVEEQDYDDAGWVNPGTFMMNPLTVTPDHPAILTSVDVKLSVVMNVSSKLDLPISTVFTCLNFYWETVAGNGHSINDDSGWKTSGFTWEEFDGFKGTPKKGQRLFDAIEIEWRWDKPF